MTKNQLQKTMAKQPICICFGLTQDKSPGSKKGTASSTNSPMNETVHLVTNTHFHGDGQDLLPEW